MSGVVGLSVDELVVARRWALLVNRVAMLVTCLVVFASAATDTHAGENVPPAWVSGLVAVAFPLALFGAEIILTRIPAVGSPASLWFRRVGAFVIGVAAFVGSAAHSVSLLERMGAPPEMAYSAPVILDFLILISGVPLVDLSDAIFKARTAATAVEPAAAETPSSAGPLGEISSTSRSSNGSVSASPSPDPDSKTTKKAQSSDLSERVAVALASDSTLTQRVLAERFGVSAKTISRTAGWQNRNTAKPVGSVTS